MPTTLVSNPSKDCTSNSPVLTITGNQTALRVDFPIELDSVNPLGNPCSKTPYNITQTFASQVSSWLPGQALGNYFKKQCNLIVVTQKEGIYLLATYPDIFSKYTNVVVSG